MIWEMNFWKKKRVFLDYASTTPLDARVKEVVEKSAGSFANPSALYSEALASKELLRQSRQTIADVLNAQSKEIYFTSGGTEGNNMALLGVFEAFKKENFIPHIIVSNIEHPAVLEVCHEIERRGGEVTIIPVDQNGLVHQNDIASALKENTVLVSVMYANNEIGTIQPIHEISRVVKDYRRKRETEYPYLHTDACQASLYLSIDVLKLGVDLMTLDGIKMYGPRSSGVLYVKSDTRISPIVFGGGQEKNLRSGTEDISKAVGLAKAFEIAESMKEGESHRLIEIRDYAIERILSTFPTATLNGSREKRLPNNINICFKDLDAEFAVISLDVLGVAVSYSSSCMNLKEDSSSYVVASLGKEECANSSLRFTLGRETNKSDIDFLLEKLVHVVNK